MSSGDSGIRELFDELKPGDRIEVRRTVGVGQQRQTTTTTGCVVRTERGAQTLHLQGNRQEAAPADVILLELPDGELTTVTMDEFTVLRRA
jgi:hypothetical protein